MYIDEHLCATTSESRSKTQTETRAFCFLTYPSDFSLMHLGFLSLQIFALAFQCVSEFVHFSTGARSHLAILVLKHLRLFSNDFKCAC
jgi:hypothetical protein